MAEIAVEVIYALPEQQALLRLSVPAGTNAREAVLFSGIAEAFPGLNVQSCPLGIFGKLLARPEEWMLEAGERAEIYRPLIAGPKEVCKQRAARARSKREGGQPRGSLRK